MTKNKQKVVPLLNDTCLAVIKNSIGSKMFRNFFAEVDGKKVDITENGNLSCALFVSSVSFLFKLIKEIHATVNGTVRDLRESGWVEIKKPKMGCVLVWQEKDFGKDNVHKHIGFYIGNNKAISNDSKLGHPARHNWNKYNDRKVEMILWHPKLK